MINCIIKLVFVFLLYQSLICQSQSLLHVFMYCSCLSFIQQLLYSEFQREEVSLDIILELMTKVCFDSPGTWWTQADPNLATQGIELDINMHSKQGRLTQWKVLACMVP